MFDGNQSFTSASFVISALRELGVFTDEITGQVLEINAAEFTPKDVYQLNIFDTTFRKPDICYEADNHLQYCQLSGQYRLILPGYSKVIPYAHMNEKCPNQFVGGIHRPLNC